MPERVEVYECSSAGRASVSKTEGRGFESLHSCHLVTISGARWSRFGQLKELQTRPMAKKTGNLAAMKQRAAKSAAAVAAPAGQGAAAAAAAEPKKPFNIVAFGREVRAEARKITWTSRKETWITAVMVFIMVIIAAIFFFVVDTALSFVVSQILKLANAG